MEAFLDTIEKLGGVVGVVALLTGGWQCWYASQFNEIEVLIAGNDWRRKRDLGIATFIFSAFLLSNSVMGMSMDKNAALVFFVLTCIFWLAGLVCATIYHIKKNNNKIAHWANGTLFGSIFFVVWIFVYVYFDNYVRVGENEHATAKLLTYFGIVALATLGECLCLLVLMRTIRSKSRVLLKLRKYESKDKELFVYRRIGNDLVCGTDTDIYSSRDIVIVPTEDVKEKGYSYGYANMNTDEEDKSKNKKQTLIKIIADKVVVTASGAISPASETKDTVVSAENIEKKSEKIDS